MRASSLPGVDSGLKKTKLLAKNLTTDEIESAQANHEYKRNEHFRDHFERIAVCGLWLVAMLVLAAGATWFWHIMTPEGWHWLQADNVSRLQNILTGGVVATVASGHFKKRLR